MVDFVLEFHWFRVFIHNMVQLKARLISAQLFLLLSLQENESKLSKPF